MPRSVITLLSGMAALLVLLQAPKEASAHLLAVTDENSTIEIDPHTESGLRTWQVDGVNHLFEQWFWYGVGATGPEASLDTLNLIQEELQGSDTIHLAYAGALLNVDVLYALQGQSAGASRIDEWVTLQSTSQDPLALRWFEYTDLDLAGTSEGDSAALAAPGTIVQSEGAASITVASLSQVPTHWQIGEFPSILGLLSDDDPIPTILADGVSPLGPGDLTFAWQYNLLLAPSGESLQLHRTHTLGPFGQPQPVPEPASVSLLGLGLGALIVRRRRA